MSHLGMGVMINMLGGDRGAQDFVSVIGKVIADAYIDADEDALIIKFEDGTGLRLRDEGQSCCEHRWMHTDDNPLDFVGAALLDARVESGGCEEDGWGYKESEFLIIETSLGAFTVVNYNEHNGYYGGFWIQASLI